MPVADLGNSRIATEKIVKDHQADRSMNTGDQPLRKFPYGTAGFRMRADLMEPIAYRVGILAALISKSVGGKWIGVMLTASHNAVHDNGVKIVDEKGEMLPERWEPIAEDISIMNEEALDKLIEEYGTRFPGVVAKVVIGRDTRPSGTQLLATARRGCNKVSSQLFDLGVVTTPELHAATARLNHQSISLDGSLFESIYLDNLATAFSEAVGGTDSMRGVRIVVDASNGVGAPKLMRLAARLAKSTGLTMQLINTDTSAPQLLNHQCGADYVKTTQSEPAGILERIPGAFYASIDGDSDRCVYFSYVAADGPANATIGPLREQHVDKFILLDGDRIGCLVATHFKRLLETSGLAEEVSLGLVQTAYANGASTAHLKQAGIRPICTPTGVKYLHRAAQDSFDIGIYFEANGHGTVLAKPSVVDRLRRATATAEMMAVSPKTLPVVDEDSKCSAAHKLLALIRLANPLIGDALSDLLLVLAVLKQSNHAVEDWIGLYDDLPNRTLKVSVRDRSAIRTEDADRKITLPLGLQQAIDRIITEYPQGRCFARPSGTEDVVRVYAEARTQSEADQLAERVAILIRDLKC